MLTLLVGILVASLVSDAVQQPSATPSRYPEYDGKSREWLLAEYERVHREINPVGYGPKPVNEVPASVSKPELFERLSAVKTALGQQLWQRPFSQAGPRLGIPERKHRALVVKALERGELVPAAVLAEYPDLRPPGFIEQASDHVRAADRAHFQATLAAVIASLDELKQRTVGDGDFFSDDWEFDAITKAWWANETSTQILTRGGERFVVRMEDGDVLKLALDPSGLAANEAELRSWHTAQGDPGALDFLVPIRESDGAGRWLVMAYAKPLPEGMEGVTEAEWDELQRRSDVYTKLLNEGRVGARDIPWFNWGWHQGTLKLLDYEWTQ